MQAQKVKPASREFEEQINQLKPVIFKKEDFSFFYHSNTRNDNQLKPVMFVKEHF
jgi:hypothetical protein